MVHNSDIFKVVNKPKYERSREVIDLTLDSTYATMFETKLSDKVRHT